MSVVGSVRLCQLPRIREAQGRCQPRGETAAAFRPLRIAMPGLDYLMRKRIQRIVVAVIAAVRSWRALGLCRDASLPRSA